MYSIVNHSKSRLTCSPVQYQHTHITSKGDKLDDIMYVDAACIGVSAIMYSVALAGGLGTKFRVQANML